MKTNRAIWTRNTVPPNLELGMVVDLFAEPGNSYIITYPDSEMRRWCCIASGNDTGICGKYHAGSDNDIQTVYANINAWRNRTWLWSRKSVSVPPSLQDGNVVLYDGVPYMVITYSSSRYVLNLLTGAFVFDSPVKDRNCVQTIWKSLDDYYADKMS